VTQKFSQHLSQHHDARAPTALRRWLGCRCRRRRRVCFVCTCVGVCGCRYVRAVCIGDCCRRCCCCACDVSGCCCCCWWCCCYYCCCCWCWCCCCCLCDVGGGSGVGAPRRLRRLQQPVNVRETVMAQLRWRCSACTGTAVWRQASGARWKRGSSPAPWRSMCPAPLQVDPEPVRAQHTIAAEPGWSRRVKAGWDRSAHGSSSVCTHQAKRVRSNMAPTARRLESQRRSATHTPTQCATKPTLHAQHAAPWMAPCLLACDMRAPTSCALSGGTGTPMARHRRSVKKEICATSEHARNHWQHER
jgi:hypothetical protein